MMLSRRTILAALPGVATLRVSGVNAATTCSSADAQGELRCSSGLTIGNVQTVRQRCKEWCWAACIEAVFSLQGRETAQEWAVRKIFGSEVCRPANPAQIIRAINGEWLDQYGLSFRAGAEQLPDASIALRTSVPRSSTTGAADDITAGLFFNDAAKRVVSELDKGNPLIIGALGHATVLTAASYAKQRSGFVGLTGLTVRDPWPDNPNRRTLSPAEVRGAFFVARVWIEK